MPRKPRKYITALNSLYHIVGRGNNERRIFRSGRDFKKFLKILKETKKKYPFYLYSYNLLSNHYHLELETQTVPISKIMHRVNFLYANYFHHRYKTSGHLFQGRFFSSLINKDSYFWEVSCYIDLNAMRAGLVKKSEGYQWGSYLIYCQKDYNDDLIDRDRFLRYGGDNLEKSRLAYLEFVQSRMMIDKKPIFPFNEKMV